MSENKNDFGFYGEGPTGYAHYTQSVNNASQSTGNVPELPDSDWGLGENSKNQYQENRESVSPMFWVIVIPILILAFMNDMCNIWH